MTASEKFVFSVLSNTPVEALETGYAGILSYLKQNRIVTLFYHLIVKAKLQGDPEFLKLLKEENRKAILKTLHMEGVFKEVLGFFDHENVDALVLKGFSLAYSIYPAKQMRAMADIDLLVGEKDYLQISDLMQRFGATPHKKNEPAGKEFISHDSSFWYKGVLLEIHRHIIPPNETVTLPVELLLKNTVVMEADGITFKTFAPELVLFYLLHHFERHAHYGLTRLSWLMDIHYFMERYKHELDQQKIAEWISLSGANNSIYYGLQMSALLLGTQTRLPIPPLDNADKEIEHYLKMCSEQISKTKKVGSFKLLSRLRGLNPKFRYIASKIFPGKTYLTNEFQLKYPQFWFLWIPRVYGRYISKLFKQAFSRR